MRYTERSTATTSELCLTILLLFDWRCLQIVSTIRRDAANQCDANHRDRKDLGGSSRVEDWPAVVWPCRSDLSSSKCIDNSVPLSVRYFVAMRRWIQI